MSNKFVYIFVVYIVVIILLLFILYQEIAIDVFGGNASDDTISITSEGAELLLDPSTDHSQLPMKLKKK